MTRKQMEQKIEQLAAELAELKAQKDHCHGTCVHWHYQTWPASTVYPAWGTYTVGSGGSYQITSS